MSYCCIDPSESVKVACMASPSCGFSALLDSTTACGLSSDYPGQVEVESLKNCTRDISRHRLLHGLSGDNALDTECKLLLARAGKAPVFLDSFSKIDSHTVFNLARIPVRVVV